MIFPGDGKIKFNIELYIVIFVKVLFFTTLLLFIN